MSPEERIKNIQNALQRRFRAAGHGSIRRVQETLKLGSGYFKDQRRPGRRRVDLRVLFRALDELSVEPADFFADALGSVDMLTVFRSEAATLRRRMKKLPRLLEVEAEIGFSDPEEAFASIEGVDFDELENEMIENPKRTVRRAHSLIRQVPSRDVPKLLGIAASANERLGHHDTAQVMLDRAFERLESQPDMKIRADLLRRASQLAARQETPERSLALSELATLDYVRSGDLVGVAATMIEQGGQWMHLARWERALRCFTSALNYLSNDDQGTEVRQRRFLCLMHSGRCHRRLGDLDQALACADQAAELSDSVSPALFGELAWLRSSIAFQSGDWRQAENCLLELLELEPPMAPLDQARASVELVRVQLVAARTLEAYETAKKLTLLVQPLERDRAASGALMELLRIALAGRGMTPDLVERVASSLKDGHAQQLAALASSAS